MIASRICIRPIDLRDLDQIHDLYFKYVAGDFIGRCGSRAFRSYLRELKNYEDGCLLCASADERIIGFNIGVIDRRRFNRGWLLKNLFWLGMTVLVKSMVSTDMRSFLLSLLSLKKSEITSQVNTSRTTSGEAMSLWLVVDEIYRGQGNDVASRLIASLEQELRKKGATRVYGYTTKNNFATILIYLKNGWRIIPNDSNYLIRKELYI